MLIHNRIGSSKVNGPGNRAVLWFQGCSLACPACWNPESHAFDNGKDTDFEKVMDWVRSLKDVEGITFSGGEPMQQAPALYLLVAKIREERPDLSLGMFTGYSTRELEEGHFKWKSALDASWVQGSPQLWAKIKEHMDFAITGRYVQKQPLNEPLRSSSNQEVLFFTKRYKAEDLAPQAVEITINPQGTTQITGFPDAGFRKGYDTPPSTPVPEKAPEKAEPGEDSGLVCA